MSVWLTLFRDPNLVRLLHCVELETEIVALFPVRSSNDLVASISLKILNVSVLNWLLRHFNLFYDLLQ
jgi:hypothetical protein